MRKIYVFSLLLLFFVSCQVTVPLSADYWKKPTKVGVLVNVHPAAKFREGSQGLLDLALTSGDKYKPVLDDVHQNMNPQQQLIDLYKNILSSKGKEVVLITENFDHKTATKFKKPENAGEKKFANYDFRTLKNKYGVDEVLFVDVNYGIMVSYYSMIETGRSAYIFTRSEIVNLNDNALLLGNTNIQSNVIKGKWNTPPYENVKNNIKIIIDKTIAAEQNIIK